MPHLTKYDIAFIGIRLLTIYILLEMISALTMSSWIVFVPDYPLPNKIMMLGMVLVFLMIPVLLWICSGKIAKWVVVSSYVETESANLKDLQSMLFAAIGVFVFVTALPTFVVGEYVLITTFMKTQHIDGWWGLFNPRVIADLLKLILSVILMFKAQGLSNLFNKLRVAG